MSVLYNSQYVDERYSKTLEPNLFGDDWLVPGVTYTDKYEENGVGGIFIHKLNPGDAVTVGTPGRDFSDEIAADELIPVVFNNNFQKSRKIYGVQAAAVGFAMGDEYLSLALKSTKEARKYAALACMINEGTTSEDTEAVTADNVAAKLTALRKAIRDAKGQCNFALVSTDVYRMMLDKLGFQEAPDPAVASGALIKRFGIKIIECNMFDNSTAKYYNAAGQLQTVDLTGVEMVVGYHEAFSALDNFNIYRIVDSEMFAGSKAQVEYNSAFAVTSPAQLVIKKKVASI